MTPSRRSLRTLSPEGGRSAWDGPARTDMRKLAISALLAALVSVPLAGCAPAVATGVGIGVMMAEDRRSAGVYIEDEELEQKAAHLYREAKLESVHANFTSYNRRVLITGEAPTEALKAKVGEIVKGIAGVNGVYNEMAIAAPTGFGSRSNDGYITAKVKTRLLDDSRVNAHHVKVVTEAGVVYLMGLLRRDEAAAAAEIAARTSGVMRVVKVIEYLD